MILAIDGMGRGELEQIMLERVWQFGRADGTKLTAQLRLIRGGYVTGYYQANESAWRIRDGVFEFLSADGETTTRFDSVQQNKDGTFTLKGRFRQTSLFHVLHEVRPYRPQGDRNATPRVAVLVRTHLANEKLFDLLDILGQSRRYDTYVLADETKTRLDVANYNKLPHSVHSAKQLGLCTEHSRLLWHCGDYALYFGKQRIPDYDYYVMLEYDVDLVRRSPLFLEGIISRFEHFDGTPIDLISPGFGLAHDGWDWRPAAAKKFPAVYTTGLFAFLAVSKRALDYLLETRIAEARSGAKHNDIVHCEAFCGSALMAGGYRCIGINQIFDNVVDFAGFHPGALVNVAFLLNGYRLDNPRAELAHPVLDLAAYLERQQDRHLKANTPEDFLRELAQLKATVPPGNVRLRRLIAAYEETAAP